MGITFSPIKKETNGMHTLREDVYVNAKGERFDPDRDKRGFLLGARGIMVTDEQARKAGLLDPAPAIVAPPPEPEAKELKPKAENKRLKKGKETK